MGRIFSWINDHNKNQLASLISHFSIHLTQPHLVTSSITLYKSKKRRFYWIPYEKSRFDSCSVGCDHRSQTICLGESEEDHSRYFFTSLSWHWVKSKFLGSRASWFILYRPVNQLLTLVINITVTDQITKSPKTLPYRHWNYNWISVICGGCSEYYPTKPLVHPPNPIKGLLQTDKDSYVVEIMVANSFK
jgi:hypothetical protein